MGCGASKQPTAHAVKEQRAAESPAKKDNGKNDTNNTTTTNNTSNDTNNDEESVGKDAEVAEPGPPPPPPRDNTCWAFLKSRQRIGWHHPSLEHVQGVFGPDGTFHEPWAPGWLAFVVPGQFIMDMKEPTMVTKIVTAGSNIPNTPRHIQVHVSNDKDSDDWQFAYSLELPNRNREGVPLPPNIELEYNLSHTSFYLVGDASTDQSPRRHDTDLLRNDGVVVPADEKSPLLKARYWRFTCEDCNGGHYVGINRWQMYGIQTSFPTPSQVTVAEINAPTSPSDPQRTFSATVQWTVDEGQEEEVSDASTFQWVVIANASQNPFPTLGGIELTTAPSDAREVSIDGLTLGYDYMLCVIARRITATTDDEGDQGYGIPSSQVLVESPVVDSKPQAKAVLEVSGESGAVSNDPASLTEEEPEQSNDDTTPKSATDSGDKDNGSGGQHHASTPGSTLNKAIDLDDVKLDEINSLSSILSSAASHPLDAQGVSIEMFTASSKQRHMNPREAMDELMAGQIDSLAFVRNNERISLFLSSTFDDTTTERNYLTEWAYPLLTHHCREHGLDFNVVDLRWGVRDTATDQHGTIDICQGEVDRCIRQSAAVSFTFFSAQRYGWVALPNRVPKEQFEGMLRLVTEETALETISAWFTLDANNLDPEYILQPISKVAKRTDIKYNQFWDNRREGTTGAQSIMQHAIWNAVDLADDPALAEFWRVSVTEREVMAGILDRPETSVELSSMCIVRELQGLEPALDGGQGESEEQAAARVYACGDTFERVNLYRLRERVKQHLPDSCVREYHIEWNGAGVSMDVHGEYVRDLCANFVRDVQARIDHVVNNTLPLNDLEKEIRHHLLMVKDRHLAFFGRRDLVSSFEATCLQGLADDNTELVVLHGVSGSGKTSLMCSGGVRVCARVRQGDGPAAVYIARLCGTSAESSNAVSVMRSVCQQIISNYRGLHSWVDEIVVPTLFDDLVDVWHRLLACGTAEKPLLIFIDSLDQLADDNRGRSQPYRWLPRSVPAHTLVCVSTLPDARYGILRQLEAGLRDKTKTVKVPKLQPSDGLQTVEDLVRQKNRTLNAAQRDAVAKSLQTAGDVTLLHLKLVADKAATWHSYDEPEEIPTTVVGLISEFYRKLEKIHGQKLVRKVFALIIASSDGLTVNNLLDLVSGDDPLLGRKGQAGAILQYHDPPVRRLPPLVLTRLINQLGGYVVERGAHGQILIQFYHRQFIETAQAMYFSESEREWRAECHTALIDYFTGDLARRFPDRQIATHPVRFNEDDSPYKKLFVASAENMKSSGKKASRDDNGDDSDEAAAAGDDDVIIAADRNVNAQRLSELPHAYLATDRVADLVKHLCTLDTVTATFESRSESLVSALLSHFHFLNRHFEGQDQLVTEFLEFTLKWAQVLQIRPELTYSLALNSPLKILTAGAEAQIASGRLNTSYLQWTNKNTEADPIIFSKKFSLPVMDVKLHRDLVAVAVGTSCLVYNVSTTLSVGKFEDHSDSVLALAFAHKHERSEQPVVASVGRDQCLRVWAADGSPVYEVESAHPSWICDVKWSSNDTLIVTASADHSARVWDARNGSLVGTLEGHTAPLTSVSFVTGIPDDVGVDDPLRGYLFTASADRSVRFWSATNVDALGVFRGHTGAVNAVSAYVASVNVSAKKNTSHPNITVVSGDSNQAVMEWHVRGKESAYLHAQSRVHKSEVSGCVLGRITPQGPILTITSGWDFRIAVLPTNTRQQQMDVDFKIDAHADWTLCVDFDATNPSRPLIASGSADQSVKIFRYARARVYSLARVDERVHDDEGYEAVGEWEYQPGACRTTRRVKFITPTRLGILHMDNSYRITEYDESSRSFTDVQKFSGVKCQPTRCAPTPNCERWILTDHAAHYTNNGGVIGRWKLKGSAAISSDVHANGHMAAIGAQWQDSGVYIVSLVESELQNEPLLHLPTARVWRVKWAGDVVVAGTEHGVYAWTISDVTATSAKATPVGQVGNVGFRAMDISTDGRRAVGIRVTNGQLDHITSPGVALLDLAKGRIVSHMHLGRNRDFATSIGYCSELDLVFTVLSAKSSYGCPVVVVCTGETGQVVTVYCHVESDDFAEIDLHYTPSDNAGEQGVVRLALVDKSGDILLLRYHASTLSA